MSEHARNYDDVRCPVCGCPHDRRSDITGFDGYRVGDNGDVWSSRVNGYRDQRGAWKQLTPDITKEGYLRITLRGPEGSRHFFVHDLVLTAFIGPRPPGMQARHFPDRDPANNVVCNLRWGTPKENSDDKVIHGTKVQGSKSPAAKLSEDDVAEMRVRIDHGESIRDVALRLGVHASRISHILAGRAWHHVGMADPSPTKRYAHKVTEADVVEMRRLAAEGMYQRDIAERFGINPSQVCRRVRGYK